VEATKKKNVETVEATIKKAQAEEKEKKQKAED